MNAEDYLTSLIKKHDDFLSKQNQLNVDIFILNAGELNFKDYFHFENHLKYLFSESKGHPTIKKTELNRFFINGNFDNPNKIVNTSIGDFRKFFKSNTLKIESLVMDLDYVLFIATIGNQVISNFLLLQNDSPVVSLDEETMNAFLKTYFNGEEQNLLNFIDEKLTDESIILEFEDFNEETIRDKIIKEIHLKANVNKNSVLSVSHEDQESLFHVHKIVKI